MTAAHRPPLALAQRPHENTSSGDCGHVAVGERPRHTLAGSAGYRRARTSVTQHELTQAGQSDGEAESERAAAVATTARLTNWSHPLCVAGPVKELESPVVAGPVME